MGDDHHLHRRIAVRCAAELGGSAAQYLDRVAAGLAVVERRCRSGPRVNVGTADDPEYVTWWERYVERPLGRRPPRAVDAAPDHVCSPAGVELDRVASGRDMAVVSLLTDAVRRTPDDPAGALRIGVRALVEGELLPERAATALEVDVDRFAAAARQLSAMR